MPDPTTTSPEQSAGAVNESTPPLKWENLEPYIPAEYKNAPLWNDYKNKPESLFKSFADTKKLVGNSIQIPSSPDDKEAWDKVWKKLGAEDAPEKYEYDTAKWAEKFEFDQDALKRFQAKAHELRMPKKQYQEMMDWYLTEVTGKAKAMSEQDASNIAVLETKLRNEYGPNYDYNKGVALKGLHSYVQDADAVEQIHELMKRSEPVFRAFVKLGNEMVEHKRIEGVRYQDFGAVDPKQARDKITEIRGNPKHPYFNPKDPGWQDAQKEMQDLYKIAYPDRG